MKSLRQSEWFHLNCSISHFLTISKESPRAVRHIIICKIIPKVNKVISFLYALPKLSHLKNLGMREIEKYRFKKPHSFEFAIAEPF